MKKRRRWRREKADNPLPEKKIPFRPFVDKNGKAYLPPAATPIVNARRLTPNDPINNDGSRQHSAKPDKPFPKKKIPFRPFVDKNGKPYLPPAATPIVNARRLTPDDPINNDGSRYTAAQLNQPARTRSHQVNYKPCRMPRRFVLDWAAIGLDAFCSLCADICRWTWRKLHR
jgi:hypothetical protein